MLLLILAGPTAVGKSELALSLAQRIGGEIVSADSMQVYRLMDIGTAKPTPAERALVPHHLIDLVYPDEPFSAARYAEEFAKVAAEVAGRGRLPIVVGGTGLYIRAAVRPFLFPDAGARPELRAGLARLAEEISPQALHLRLAEVDPEAAERIHPNDLRRIIRALEVYEATGRPISAWQRLFVQRRPYETVFVCLTRERGELYRRIEARAEKMIAAGLVEEVKSLLAAGYGRELPPMQGLGYREICSYLHGECTLAEAVEIMKKRTRHYAKRQLTWFRREPVELWLDLTLSPEEEARAQILRLLAGRWERSSNS